jgi:hypothetical protein
MHDTLRNVYQNLKEKLKKNMRPRRAWEGNTETRNEDAEIFLTGLK